MTETEAEGRVASVAFTGTRSDLFGLLVRGSLLTLPTIGLYRFWLVTWKRRFYWHNTLIDGDALEYTGTAMQLLIGFLFALGFFLPIYVAFFYLSTQSREVAIIGYLVVGVALWFLTGYAIYRARDFRLSRTLWRGIRFDQRGSAWNYAIRRFLWSILVIMTLGLAYPFMAGNLWRYRYTHTWYGNRQFAFSGSWKKVAGPFYLVYFGVVALVLGTLFYIGSADDFVVIDGDRIPGPLTWLLIALTGLFAFLGFFYFRSRETTRMFSAIAIGPAVLKVRVKARALVGLFLLYCLAIIGASLAFLVVAGMLAGSVFASSIMGGEFDPAQLAAIFQSSWVTVVVLILAYLAFLAAFSILGEVVLGYGFWALVCRGATISNPDSLRSVGAASEDTALAGEGLADALNVGAY